MRRLAHQIHVTILAVLVLIVVLFGVGYHVISPEDDVDVYFGTLSLMAARIPAADAEPDSLRGVIDELSMTISSPLGVWDPDGALVYRSSEGVEWGPTAMEMGPEFDASPGAAKARVRGHEFTVAKRLHDGRWLVLHHESRRRGLAHFMGLLVVLTFAIGVGSLPMTRRLTRRLERLRSRVEKWGQGDLSARIEVEGHDEVAALAHSFNGAAERIEHLVDSQRTTLAGASHELRSPLTRLRVAADLLADQGVRSDLQQRVADDIDELDSLIDEILLATRLDALPDRESREDVVDLLALAAEEGARFDADVSGEAVQLRGNDRLLRRLVRNLVDNGARHGTPRTLRLQVARPDSATVRLDVSNDGPVVDPAERERIFEPFYRPAGSPESGQGYGLGLALVRRIARLHNGDVQCLAIDGRTCFRVQLSMAT